MHFVAPINDQFGWGASVTSNYGLATEFNNDYAAGAFGGKTDLETLNLNLSGAYVWIITGVSALAFDAVYAKAKIERYAGDLGKVVAGSGALPPALAQRVAGIPADTQIAYLKGDEWGFGWNAGILYELDKNNRYGFTYRSEVKSTLMAITKAASLLLITRSSATSVFRWGPMAKPLAALLSLHLPEMWELSGYNKVAPQWAVHYSLTYTSWSQFQELKATNSNGDTLFYKDESFRDAYRIALGTTYYMDDNWTFRTGIAFDDSPVPADKRSISIPDQDRFWLSAGATYAFNKDASIDAGISYMHGQKVNFKEGPYEFSSEGKAWLYGMNFNYAF
ncbi:long-chain fatty acid transport protein [Enterobacter asburiae]|uniref:Long-chain fatty acid transport protein n=1 Tax=Enterobacter asburiae TaxID=61645 RepID=A0A376FLE6_ENTAS|nr:long-chain fatty acid transport protein [Enterobacter asburiae]